MTNTTGSTTRYAITAQELSQARAYLRRKLVFSPYWLDNVDAELQFERLPIELTALNDWCQRWLDNHQWQHRRRQASSDAGPDVHIRLSRQAHSVITALAKRDGITLSQFIVQHHYQAWLDLEPPETVSTTPSTLTTTPRSE